VVHTLHICAISMPDLLERQMKLLRHEAFCEYYYSFKKYEKYPIGVESFVHRRKMLLWIR
jgi:hypothetical protein